MKSSRNFCLGGCILLLCLYAGHLTGTDASKRTDEPVPPVFEERLTPRAAADPFLFISVWDTTQTSGGSGNSSQIKLPLLSGGVYDFTVDWGDGNTDTITSWDQTQTNHTYDAGGVYTVNISGILSGWQFDNGGDRLKLLEIQQWGSLNLGNSGSYFYGCSNLSITATDSLNLTGTTDLTGAFRGCSNLGSSGNMSGWDVQNVTDMSYMFYGTTTFNQSIGGWNVSSVTSMTWMFYGATSFNQPIGSWDVSSVADMRYMFREASSFNQPIDSWNVSSVTTMNYMFGSASSFDQIIDSWNVSGVKNMNFMFSGASSFNQPIGWWDVSNVTKMRYTFSGASSFNQPIGGWDVSSVTAMDSMFSGASLSAGNYDDLLNGWSLLSLQSDVLFDAGSSRYSIASATARQSIIDTFNWTVTDGGLILLPSPPVLTINTSSPTLSVLINLTWTSSQGAANYTLYRHTSAINTGNIYSTAQIATITNTSFIDTVPGLGTWYYAVTASNASGDSTPSSSPSVLVQALPGVPTLNISTSSPTTSTTISLNWTSVMDADNYTLYRYTAAINAGNLGSATPVTTITGTSTEDTVPSPGMWYYAVTSKNASGSSDPSTSPSILVQALPGVPTLNINTSSPTTSTTISLNWTSIIDADNYTLYRYTSQITAGNLGSATQIKTIAALSTQDTPSLGSWFYAVVASNENGTSAPSNSPSIEVVPPSSSTSSSSSSSTSSSSSPSSSPPLPVIPGYPIFSLLLPVVGFVVLLMTRKIRSRCAL